MDLPAYGHEPVLMDEVLRLLDPGAGQVVVDATIGRGGHSLAIARKLGPDGMLIGIDADPRNLEFAAARLKDVPSLSPIRLFHANFSELSDVLRQAGILAVDAILADLGISTNQLWDAEYGLSFDRPMALDMRLDPRQSRSAADWVNQSSESELADVLYQLAQERYSRRISKKIVEARRVSPIKTTERLAELVRSAMPRRGGAPERIDPATRTFLALRMAVNQEMENLAALLKQAPLALKPGGRLAVISFQSMEDRAVKQAFRSLEQTGLLAQITKKPLSPTSEELAGNPRSRSAKLRVASKRLQI